MLGIFAVRKHAGWGACLMISGQETVKMSDAKIEKERLQDITSHLKIIIYEKNFTSYGKPVVRIRSRCANLFHTSGHSKQRT